MVPMRQQASLEQRIEKVKQQIAALGDLHPGTLTVQYNVCGSSGCRCKATPPIKHGPYHQLSFTRHGKSTSRFVGQQDVTEAQEQLDNYRRLRQLVNDWIDLSVELARSRVQQRRQATAGSKKKPKSSIPSKTPKGASKSNPNPCLN